MPTEKYLPKFKYGTAQSVNSTTVVPGTINVTYDTQQILVDLPNGNRIRVTDVITVNTYNDLPIAPLDKFYVVKDTSDLYYFNNIQSEWIKLSNDIITSNDFSTLTDTDKRKVVLCTENNGTYLAGHFYKYTEDDTSLYITTNFAVSYPGDPSQNYLADSYYHKVSDNYWVSDSDRDDELLYDTSEHVWKLWDSDLMTPTYKSDQCDVSLKPWSDEWNVKWNSYRLAGTILVTADAPVSITAQKTFVDITAGASTVSWTDITDKPFSAIDTTIKNSTNPVTNTAISSALAKKANSSHTHTVANITNFSSSVNTILNANAAGFQKAADVSTIVESYGYQTSANVTSIIAAHTDTALDSSSLNPVQNKVVSSAIAQKLDTTTFNAFSTSISTAVDTVSAAVETKASSSHTHVRADITDLGSVLTWKGAVANSAALPSTAEAGDTYHTNDTGSEYAWDGTKWELLGGAIDLSGYATDSELNTVSSSLSTEIDNVESAIESGLSSKADSTHTHATSDITNYSDADNDTIVNTLNNHTVVGIKETNSSATLKFWKGTLSKYEEQNKATDNSDDLCIIIDDDIQNVSKSPMVGVANTNNLTVTEDQVVYWTPVGDGTLTMTADNDKYTTAIVFARVASDRVVQFSGFDTIIGEIQTGESVLNKIMIESIGTGSSTIKIVSIMNISIEA